MPNRRFGLLTVPAMKHPRGVQLPFDIPCDSIVSVELQRHPSPIALMEVMDIKYREGDVVQEKCIASYRKTIRHAHRVLVDAKNQHGGQ